MNASRMTFDALVIAVLADLRNRYNQYQSDH